MPKSQVAPAKTTQPQTAKPKPAPQEDVSSQAQLAELEKLVMDSSLEGQGDAVGNPAILTPQRQHMAKRIGQVQGNRHLQRVVKLVKRSMGSVIQRQPGGGGGGGGATPASPVQIQHTKAVDVLKKSYGGSIKEEGTIEEKSLDDFNKFYDDQKKGQINPDTGVEWQPGDTAKKTERIFGVQYGAAHIVVPILPAQGGQDPNADENRISTIAHEILHANCKIRGAVPLLLEETATEYLAVKACQAAGINPSISKYSNAMDTFYEVARQVGGTGVIQDAYFNGGVEKFQTPFDAAKGAGAWKFFVDAMNSGRNADAKEVLMHGTRGDLFTKKKSQLYNIVNAVWITDEELVEFQQGWGELLKAEKDICRPFFQSTIDKATFMRDTRKESLQNTMAT